MYIVRMNTIGQPMGDYIYQSIDDAKRHIKDYIARSEEYEHCDEYEETEDRIDIGDHAFMISKAKPYEPPVKCPRERKSIDIPNCKWKTVEERKWRVKGIVFNHANTARCWQMFRMHCETCGKNAAKLRSRREENPFKDPPPPSCKCEEV